MIDKTRLPRGQRCQSDVRSAAGACDRPAVGVGRWVDTDELVYACQECLTQLGAIETLETVSLRGPSGPMIF